MSSSAPMTSVDEIQRARRLRNSYYHARTRDTRTGSGRRARRKVSFNSGGRIRPRRNGTHSRRKTWRELGQASDRDWSVEGAAGRCEITAAKARLTQNKASSEA